MINQITDMVDIPTEVVVNLLPLVLIEVRNYTNQYFLTKTNSRVIKVEDGKIYLEDTSQFKQGNTVEIINSENNTSLYSIQEVLEDHILVDQYVMDEDDLNYARMIKLSFRGVNLYTVSNMMQFMSDRDGEIGVASKSLGNFSVSYNANSTSKDSPSTIFPQELYGGLNALKKINDGGKEYWRKGYDIT